MEKFDYEKPEIMELKLTFLKAEGESCLIDCGSNDICPTPDDEI